MRVVLLLCLVACTGAAPDESTDDDDGFGAGKEDSPGSDWTMVGRGVAYQRVNTGPAILIAYGGYTARLSYAAAWATELVDARLGAAGVGHIYAVQGPADPGYAAREIANTRLRAHLATLADSTAPIYVVGHSSGSYVAHELLSQLYNVDDVAVLARIGYADLDGGGAGLSDSIVASLRAITFAYAHDPAAGYSENHDTARALGAEFAPKATTFAVELAGTGCTPGAGWCMHDVLITHRPHDHDSFDLARDYTDFVGRAITTEYLDRIAM